MKARGLEILTEAHAKYIFYQMALGLKDIHLEGIVHRDIKHRNIFLSNKSKRPKVRIADFGLACYPQEDECFV